MRTDRKTKESSGETTNWVCLLIPQLKNHMDNKEKRLPSGFQDALQSLYGASFRQSAPTLFLKPGSTRDSLPTGETGRRSADCCYVRCCMIERNKLTAETLKIQDKGKINVHT